MEVFKEREALESGKKLPGVQSAEETQGGLG